MWEAYGLEMDDELIGELSEAEADAVLGMSVMVLGDEQLQLRPEYVTSFESTFVCRQIPQIRSPQTRTMGRGGKRVFAGDGGYGSRGVDRRRQIIPGREAISRGQGAKRGEKESKGHHGTTEQQNTTVHVPCGN